MTKLRLTLLTVAISVAVSNGAQASPIKWLLLENPISAKIASLYGPAIQNPKVLAAQELPVVPEAPVVPEVPVVPGIFKISAKDLENVVNSFLQRKQNSSVQVTAEPTIVVAQPVVNTEVAVVAPVQPEVVIAQPVIETAPTVELTVALTTPEITAAVTKEVASVLAATENTNVVDEVNKIVESLPAEQVSKFTAFLGKLQGMPATIKATTSAHPYLTAASVVGLIVTAKVVYAIVKNPFESCFKLLGIGQLIISLAKNRKVQVATGVAAVTGVAYKTGVLGKAVEAVSPYLTKEAFGNGVAFVAEQAKNVATKGVEFVGSHKTESAIVAGAVATAVAGLAVRKMYQNKKAQHLTTEPKSATEQAATPNDMDDTNIVIIDLIDRKYLAEGAIGIAAIIGGLGYGLNKAYQNGLFGSAVNAVTSRMPAMPKISVPAMPKFSMPAISMPSIATTKNFLGGFVPSRETLTNTFTLANAHNVGTAMLNNKGKLAGVAAVAAVVGYQAKKPASTGIFDTFSRKISSDDNQ